MSAYLQNLTLRLAAGIGHLPDETRSKHARYLRNAQRPDGGFGGRMDDESDLYYSSFALRALGILDELDENVTGPATSYLRSNMSGHRSIIDLFSLIYSSALLYALCGIEVFADADPNWDENIASFLSSLRREDGGFAKATEGSASSTYHTFLVLLVMELIGQEISQPERIVSFLQTQLAEGGGYREIRAKKRAGTNPTAAAVASLKILGRLNEEKRPDHSRVDHQLDETIDFLLEMQNDEGGLLANSRIPFADSLSTFTGMLTLDDLDEMHELDLDRVGNFVNALQLPDGGFRAVMMDEGHDVEYTFYGLGCLALLANHEHS